MPHFETTFYINFIPRSRSSAQDKDQKKDQGISGGLQC